MKRLMLILLVLTLASTQTSAQCDSLYTLYAEDNSQDGIMFDIVAIENVTINRFDCALQDSVVPKAVSIYYKHGSHVGFEQDSLAWTLIDSAVGVMGNGLNIPTPIPILVNQTIQLGDTMAFYITGHGLIDQTHNMTYTNGVALGNVYSSNSAIAILEGAGCNYPFDVYFTPRIPNITVHHSCVPLSVSSETNYQPLTIYPNPTTSHIRIQLLKNNFKAKRTSLYDMTGRLVHQQPFNPNMDVGYLDSGTYIVLVETEDGNFRGTVQKE